MNLIRLVLILVAIWIILRLWREYRSHKRVRAPGKPKIANMVRCDFCGLHIPEADAVREGNKYFCSEDHRKRIGH